MISLPATTSMGTTEGSKEEAVDEDTRYLADLLASVGALDIYVLPLHSANQLIEARERAFSVSKENGADDIFDVGVPPPAMPEYLEPLPEIGEKYYAWIARAGHVGDGNVHLAVFQAEAEERDKTMHAIFATRPSLGGVTSVEDGVGSEKSTSWTSKVTPSWRRCAR